MNLSEQPTEPTLPLAGKKFYSPAAIAAYTVLANMPVGCVLYGLNLQARGSRTLGRFVVGVGVAGWIGLSAAVLTEKVPSRHLRMLSIVAAFCFYSFEKAPVAAALRKGAILARWWPPALWVAGAIGVLFAVAYFMP